MSVTKIEEMWPGRGGKFGGVEDSSRTRKWRVRTDNKFDGEDSIISYGISTGKFPERFTAHPNNPKLTARSLNADNQEDSPYHWIVTCEYTSAPISKEQKDKEDNPNPNDRPAKIKWVTSLYREAIVKDQAGKAILNSAGDYPDPPVERDRSNWTISISKNIPAIPTWLLDYNNCPINDSSFTVQGLPIDPEKARLTTVEIGEENEENGFKYYPIRLELELKKEGWKTSILDQGFRELKVLTEGEDPEQVHIQVADENGVLSNITSPALLDGEGLKIPNPTPDDAKYLDYDTNEKKDFSVLPLA